MDTDGDATESDALSWLTGELGVGDDCGSVATPSESDLLVTTDMLHETTDLPDGVTDHVVGWRSVAVSLSDLAASGARPVAVVLAYGAPSFDGLDAVVGGAREVCDAHGAGYIGGDLDGHDERTLVSTAVGATDSPVGRDGASPGDVVAVTGSLCRTAVALRAFDEGDTERANSLFGFDPRVEEGMALSPYATAMTDLSDGIAVGLHNLADASGVGFEVRRDDLPTHEDARDDDVFVGGDYELLFTLPEDAVADARRSLSDTPLTVVGDCVREGVRMDGEDLGRRGYEH